MIKLPSRVVPRNISELLALALGVWVHRKFTSKVAASSASHVAAEGTQVKMGPKLPQQNMISFLPRLFRTA